MANTEKPISIRIPAIVLKEIDGAAGRLERSRAWVIVRLLELAIVGERPIEYILGRLKKIADVSDGGEAQSGTQDLPRGGKAQDGENIPTTHKCCGFEGVVTRGAGGVFDVVTCDCKCHENSEPDTEIGMTTRELGELGQKIFGKVVRRNKNAEKENMPEVQKDDAPDADRKFCVREYCRIRAQGSRRHRRCGIFAPGNQLSCRHMLWTNSRERPPKSIRKSHYAGGRNITKIRVRQGPVGWLKAIRVNVGHGR